MAAPSLEVSQETLGRVGEFTARCVWTQANPDNLDTAVLLDLDTISGKILNPRFALLSLEWNVAPTVSIDIEFASLPWTSDNVILTIPPGSGAGEISWEGHLDGRKTEPNRDAPGDVVITSRNALPGDELFLTGRYIEKGTATP